MRAAFVPITLLCAISLTGCRSDSLDYNTAMSLLRDRNLPPIRLSFSANPPRGEHPANAVQAYKRLVDARILTCIPTEGAGEVCQPGPAGDSVSVDSASELSIVAGHWVPTTVVSISRAPGGSATADVQMNFEPSPLYREFEGAFDVIQLQRTGVVDDLRNGKMVHATFQHDDDGWHVESVS